jgi:hypothetical protein
MEELSIETKLELIGIELEVIKQDLEQIAADWEVYIERIKIRLGRTDSESQN